MILLGTHIWVYWMNGTNQLSLEQTRAIAENADGRIGLSQLLAFTIAHC